MNNEDNYSEWEVPCFALAVAFSALFGNIFILLSFNLFYSTFSLNKIVAVILTAIFSLAFVAFEGILLEKWWERIKKHEGL